MSSTTDYILQTDVLASYLGPALIQRAQFLNGTALVERFPNIGLGVKTVKFRKGGYLTASTVSEGSNYSSPSTRTQTSVSITAAKKVSGDKNSVEAIRFAGSEANRGRIMTLMGGGLARLYDSDFKALIPSITAVQTSATTLTAADFLTAIYLINTNSLMNTSGDLESAISLKQSLDLGKDLLDKTASAYANPALLALIGLALDFKLGERGFKGSLYGVNIVETTGLTQSGGDDIGGMWDRQHAFGVGLDTIPSDDGAGILNGQVSVTGPQAGNGIAEEIIAWMYWNMAIINNEFAAKVKSDS